MTASHELFLTTRFSDLDPQRHINNSYYEIYTREARYLILQQHGYDYTRCVAEEIYLRPLATEVTFHRQQGANTDLKIITQYEQNKDGLFRWLHTIQNAHDGSIACEIEHRSLLEKKEQPFALETPEMPFATKAFPELDPIAEFNNSCKRSLLKIEPRHTDMDGFKKFPSPSLWRYNEEARWKFISDSGLSFHTLKSNDRALFWVHGIYDYGDPVKLHSEITIYTWARKMEGARIYIRQYSEDSNTRKKIMDVQGEFLTVVLSRSRPIRIPDFIRDAFNPYTENMAATHED